MFIAALSTTAKTWKQPNCPLTDEQSGLLIQKNLLQKMLEEKKV